MEDEQEQQNPCRFKKVCKMCRKVEVNERPDLCEQIRCEDYTICPGCGKNKTLHEYKGKSLCKYCHTGGGTSGSAAQKTSEEKKLIKSGRATLYTVKNDEIEKRIVSISPPGEAPPELNPKEKDYYNSRWDQYKGYYRNPSAYFICHMIIIEEINLSYLNAKLLSSRGEAASEYSKERTLATQMLKLLTDQLPDREAEEVMDDEKSLSVIYEKYTEEKRKRYRSGVARMLSPEALALAPVLIFPVNVQNVLERCGFKTIGHEELIHKIETENNLESKSPDEILEFFGFKINEEYALDFHLDKDISPEAEELDSEEDETPYGNLG